MLDKQDRQIVNVLRSSRLDILNSSDVNFAADILAQGKKPVISLFGNILGIFGNPSSKSVAIFNKIKGRPKNQIGSITTTPEYFEEVAAWHELPNKLQPKKVLEIINTLNAVGPIGFMLPAADKIPAHLSHIDSSGRIAQKTVQLIIPGKNCPSNNFFSEVLKKISQNFIFATSGNISKNLRKGKEQPAHYLVNHLLKDFEEIGEKNLIALTFEDENNISDLHPFHDQRSTTIINLCDVVRDQQGTEIRDKNGMNMLKIVRNGSMNTNQLTQILGKLNYGTVFSTESRLSLRTYNNIDEN